MNSLTTIAIVGTGQQRPEKIETGTPIDTLATQLPTGNIERALLLAAGAEATYRQAGYQATQAPAAPPLAPEETRQACSKEAAYLLDLLLKGPYEQLLPEALERLQAAHLRIPYELLPQLLRYGTEHRQIRAALIPVIGERGRWLSQFNTSWAWVQQFLPETSRELPADAETIWQEGTTGQRSEILRRLRAVDAAKARAWLAAVWKQEKAEVRNALLAALEVSLSAEDEIFLDTALDDRSATVKASVAALLARIPGSALSQRMQKRADMILSFEKGILKKGKLTLHPLPEPDEHWKRDGLQVYGDQNKLTRDAAKQLEAYFETVEQIIALVPPGHWTERFASTPQALLGALKNLDGSDRLRDAWSQAACLHQDQQWAGLLLGLQLSARNFETVRILLPLLSQQAAEHSLKALSLNNNVQSMLLDMLPRPWSTEFSEHCLQTIRAQFEEYKKKTKNTYYYNDRRLSSLAVAMSPICFEQAQQLEELLDDDPQNRASNYIDQLLSEFIETLNMRKRIIEEI